MVGKFTTNQVSAPIDRNDLDGEGLLNVWEANEMGINNDGMKDPYLPFQKTNPLHKDTYVQIDYMEFYRPNSDPIDNLIIDIFKSV